MAVKSTSRKPASARRSTASGKRTSVSGKRRTASGRARSAAVKKETAVRVESRTDRGIPMASEIEMIASIGIMILDRKSVV